MTRQLDLDNEVRQQNLDNSLVSAVNYRLAGQVAHAGGVLTGLSFKIEDHETLMTIRAIVAGKPMIAFVGSESLAACFRKATVLAGRDDLRWREDRYHKK